MRGWTRRALAASLVAAIAGLVLPATIGARGASETKVVCNKDYPSYKPQFRITPRHCVFHQRGEPNASAFFVRTQDIKWKFWRSGGAKGKGKAIANMTGATPVRIKLWRPKTRCDRRVFAKARFRFPGIGTGGKMTLDVCP